MHKFNIGDEVVIRKENVQGIVDAVFTAKNKEWLLLEGSSKAYEYSEAFPIEEVQEDMTPSEQGSEYGHAANDEVALLDGAIDIRHTDDDANFIVRPGQEVQEDEYDPELDESLPVTNDDKSERLEKLNKIIPDLEDFLEFFKQERDLLLEELNEDASEQ